MGSWKYKVALRRGLFALACSLVSTAVWSDTPEDNQSNLDTISFLTGALDTSIVLGIVPFDPVSRPAELQEFGVNLGLKVVAPVFNPPSDLFLDPRDVSPGDPCRVQFTLPQTEAKYENWFGFWDIDPLDESWSLLGQPSVLHSNTTVKVRTRFNGSPVGSNSRSFHLPEGELHFDWEAATQISGFWDVGFPLGMMQLNSSIESRYGAAISKKITKGSAKSAAKIKLKLAVAAKNIATRIGEDAIAYTLEDGFGDSHDTISTFATQDLTVWDVHTPKIMSTTSTPMLEARNFGGTLFSRAQEDLIETLTYNDDCGREVWLTNDAPKFLPIGTTEINWTVHDGGLYKAGVPSTSSITQLVTIADTQPPLLVPPAGFARETNSSVSVSGFDFGKALVSDLADPNPSVDKMITRNGQLVDTMMPGARYQVLYTATDASDNTTADDEEHPDKYTQTVTFKLPGTNTAPTAMATSADAITSKPVAIQLGGSDSDEIDGQFDPLEFHIDEDPDNGQFVIPDYPFFIEDFRLKPQEPITGIDPRDLSCLQDDGLDESDVELYQGKLAQLEATDHFRWVQECYCKRNDDPPR
jgi:hypothetical protein